MQTITINATNTTPQTTAKMRGRCEVNFEGLVEGMTSLVIEVQHYDSEGALIEPSDDVYEVLLDNTFATDTPVGFAYDKRNSTYRLKITPAGTLTDTNYNIHIA